MTLELTTPKTLSDFVIKSAAKLSGEAPQYVVYAPYNNALEGECFLNVEKAVAANGGSMVTGWLIWELEDVLIEAEHHAVWQKTDGSVVDVTPKADGELRIVFVPDSSAAWTGVGISNKRFAGFGATLARDYIKLANEVDALIDPYRKVGFYNVPAEVGERSERLAIKGAKILEKLLKGRRK